MVRGSGKKAGGDSTDRGQGTPRPPRSSESDGLEESLGLKKTFGGGKRPSKGDAALARSLGREETDAGSKRRPTPLERSLGMANTAGGPLNPGPGSVDERDELFASLAVEMGLLTPGQIEDCRAAIAQIRSVGGKTSFEKFVVGNGLLTPRQARSILREMRKHGVLPTLGGYELISKLGQGGMGVVYKARQVSLDRILALKVLPAELTRDLHYVARFRREGLLASKIVHPNAVQVFDVGHDKGRYFMAMEFIDGADVAKNLERGPMDEQRALSIVRDVARALAVAHDQSIVHRDIKPANIMLTRDGAPKLSDLGIAKQTAGLGASLTQTGATIGTPHYMSPEQCRGQKDIDGRSDIYSLGATLFHMVCGRFPFEGDTTIAVMRKQLEEPMPDPRSLNPGLSDGTVDLLRRMMEKDREKRFQTCEELVDAIGGIARAAAAPTAPMDVGAIVPKPEPSPPTPPPEPAARTGKRQGVVIAAVAIGLIALLLMAIPFLRAASKPKEVVLEPEAHARVPSASSRTDQPAPLAKPARTAPDPARAAQAPELKESRGTLDVDLGGGVKMEFVYITHGRFTMGYAFGPNELPPRAKDKDAFRARHKPHEVEITKEFCLGVHEVTVGQFKQFVEETGYETSAEGSAKRPFARNEKGERLRGHWTWRSPGFTQTDRHPVCFVSWFDAQKFVEWLSSRTGRAFRLPTEAEWEYACRAGAGTAYPWGATPKGFSRYANASDAALKDRILSRAAQASEVDGYVFTAPVGSFSPNAWGLYDMVGNVAEWCEDAYDLDFYAKSPKRDPKLGDPRAARRVFRGMSWLDKLQAWNVAIRGCHPRPFASQQIGFRVACAGLTDRLGLRTREVILKAWEGTVDRDLVLSVRSATPARLRLAQLSGRMPFRVWRHPLAENKLEGLVYVSDTGPGADYYRLRVYGKPLAEQGPAVNAPGPDLVLVWEGVVDRECAVTFGSGHVATDKGAIHVATRCYRTMPIPRGARVRLIKKRGRGRPVAVPDPKDATRITKVVISDPSPGPDYYRFELRMAGRGETPATDVPAQTPQGSPMAVLTAVYDELIGIIEREYVRPIKIDRSKAPDFNDVLRQLDPHCGLLDPEQLRSMSQKTSGAFGGLGVNIRLIQGQLTITAPIRGTPAWRAGVLAGERIVGIDGRDTEGMSLLEAVALLRGKPGSEVRLTLGADDTSPRRVVRIIRAVIKPPPLESAVIKPPRIGWIRVPYVTNETPRALRAAIGELRAKGVRALALDLRGNTGGRLGAVLDVADEFLRKGNMGGFATRDATAAQVRTADMKAACGDWPLAVMVDGETAGGAEIIACALKDNGRARLVGARTFGKCSVQKVVRLKSGDYALKFTYSRFIRPNGKALDDGVGVTPDVPAPNIDEKAQREAELQAMQKGEDPPLSAIRRDPVVIKAVEILRDQLGGAASGAPAMAKWPFNADEANRRQKEANKELTRRFTLSRRIMRRGSRRVRIATAQGEQSISVTYYANTIGMILVLAPPGEFMMGSEKGGDAEKPAHRVKIAKPFLIGAYEVTNAQYRRFRPEHSSGVYGKASLNGDGQPVVRVSWLDANAFCKWLSAREKALYRLPTEAEWEYACRAGAAGDFHWGDQPTDKGLNFLGARDGHEVTAPVGSYPPNAFGLYDTSGNVREWLQSILKPYPYRADDGREDLGAPGMRVLRGGSWADGTGQCRSSYRFRMPPETRYFNWGFRVVRPCDK